MKNNEQVLAPFFLWSSIRGYREAGYLREGIQEGKGRSEPGKDWSGCSLEDSWSIPAGWEGWQEVHHHPPGWEDRGVLLTGNLVCWLGTHCSHAPRPLLPAGCWRRWLAGQFVYQSQTLHSAYSWPPYTHSRRNTRNREWRRRSHRQQYQ